jgi:hypothetical protein
MRRTCVDAWLLLSLLSVLVAVGRATCPSASVFPESGTVVFAANLPTVHVEFSEEVAVHTGGLWTSLRSLAQPAESLMAWMVEQSDPSTDPLPFSLRSDATGEVELDNAVVDVLSPSRFVVLLDFRADPTATYYTMVVRGNTFRSVRNPTLFVEGSARTFYPTAADVGPCLAQPPAQTSELRCVDAQENQAPSTPSPLPVLPAWESSELVVASLYMSLGRDAQGHLEVCLCVSCVVCVLCWSVCLFVLWVYVCLSVRLCLSLYLCHSVYMSVLRVIDVSVCWIVPSCMCT